MRRLLARVRRLPSWGSMCRVGCGALLLAGVSACDIARSIKPAEAVVDSHFSSLEQTNLVAVLANYSRDFLEQPGKEGWAANLLRLLQRVGHYETHSFVGHHVWTQSGIDGGVRWVTVYCRVRYSKGETAEVFTLRSPVGTNDFRITSHQATSSDLLK